MVWFFVVVGAKARQPFVAEIGFYRIHSSYQHIESTVKLLLIEDQRIIHVALHEILMVEGRLGQVCKLLEKYDAIATLAL